MAWQLFAQSPIPDSAYSLILQAGFAGFALTLLIILYFIVRDNAHDRNATQALLMGVLKETSQVISDNTHVIESLKESAVVTNHIMQDVRDKLLERPCLLPKRPYDIPTATQQG